MSDLTDTARALEAIDVDVSALEAAAAAQAVELVGVVTRAKEHEQADANRFLQVHAAIGEVMYKMDHFENLVTLLRDSMHEGFAALGAKIEKKDPNDITPPRRRRNGQ